MNLDSLLNEIKDKYGYTDELVNAIKITIPLMVAEYGENSIDDILRLFQKTRIFATSDMGYENRKIIEKQMIGNYNSHIKSEEIDPYQNGDSDPGSYYSFETLYDEEMNIIGEARWLVVKDMKDSFNEEGYSNLFGTTINMPYFIHEINHAFAMQNAIYRKKDNIIESKHGMYEQVQSFNKDNGQISLIEESNAHIILEEAINEKITQDMLVNLLNAKEYSEVESMLSSIKHVSSSYSSILIGLANKFSNILGKDRLMQYRKDNNKEIIDEFNLLASQGEIGKKYVDNENPFEYFSKKSFELFRLKCECYKMSIEEYSRRSKELMVGAFAPLCSYQEIKFGTTDLSKFEETRNELLGIEKEKTI